MIKHRLLVAVFASMAMTGWSQEIIIESYADGQNSQAFSSVEGRWTESTAKSTAEGLTATKALFNDADTDPAVARFTPDIPATGEYEIFITYPTSGNASDIKYTVVHADGTEEISLTQYGREFSHNPAANKWSSIGTFKFNQGTSGYVEVADPLTGEKPMAAEPNARIYADAVKFVGKGGTAATSSVPSPESTVSAESEAANAAAAAAATATPTAPASALPALPSTSPTPADMPGLSTAQATPAPDTAMPALPPATETVDAAAQLPGLPSSTPADPVAALPSLPGATDSATATPGSTAMPGLPASTPETASAMPDLPSASATPGLPDLPTAAVEPTSTPGLPDLPSMEQAATTAVTTADTVTVTAQATPYPVPDLPSLAPVTPTPQRTLPSPSDTPAAGVPPAGLVGGALSNLPPMPTAAPAPSGLPVDTMAPMGTPGAMPPSGLPGDMASPMGTPPVGGAVPGMPGASPTPPPPGTSISQYNPANLQWVYDFGSALNTARAQNKKVLVFFTANGNRAAHTYETEYFTNPAVRQVLSNYVLVKVDFPKNTRLGYSLGIFGAGMIVVADKTGEVTARIEQLPSSPPELVQQMSATGPLRRSTAKETPAADAAATTDPAALISLPGVPATTDPASLVNAPPPPGV